MVQIGGRAHSNNQIRQVGELGYPYAEIDLYDPDRLSRKIDVLKALQDEYGIYYLAHYPNEDNPLDIEVLRTRFLPKMTALFELSRQLGVTKGTLHFWIDRRRAPSGLIPEKIELLSKLTSLAAAQGVQLCIENLSERHDSFSAAFEAIPELGMTLDIGHAQLLASRNTSFDFIANNFSRIRHVHVHDNRGGVNVEDDLHLALGEGIVDYAEILGSLLGRGYNSTLTMEVKIADMPRTREAIIDTLP